MLLKLHVMSVEAHPSKTDIKCFLLSFLQLLLLQDSLLPPVLLLSWQKLIQLTTSTTSFYVFKRCTEAPASQCVTSYSEINLFRSLSWFFSSACKRTNRCDAWFAAAPARQGVFGIEWEISHSLRPADLWPCCTSAAPASAAARRPPARPGAAAEHPNARERETGALKKHQRRPWYKKKTSICTVSAHTPSHFIKFTNIHYIYICIKKTVTESVWHRRWSTWMNDEWVDG